MADISTRNSVLGFDDAAHLLRRATFKPTKALITQFANYTASQAVDALFVVPTNLQPEPVASDTGAAFFPSYTTPNPTGTSLDAGQKIQHVYSWQLNNYCVNPSAYSKIAFFLHSIFISDDVIGVPENSFDYHSLLNYYASRSIKDFAKKVTMSNSMMYYLNNNYNRVGAPNENYAREFLELFTITKGPQDGVGSYTNYTELDVQMAAKVLTGFALIAPNQRLSYLDPVCNIPLGTTYTNWHDTTNKTFSAKFNNQTIIGSSTSAGMNAELDNFINMVFNQPETAKSYARRLYRYFVRKYIDAEIESDIITPLANNLLNTNYDLPSTIKLLLKCNHFYDLDDSVANSKIIGAKIKSPLELVLLMINQFQVTFPSPSTNASAWNSFLYNTCYSVILQCNYPLFRPINVAGYPAFYESDYDTLWIDTSNLKNRYNLLFDQLLNGITYNGATIKLDLVDFVRNGGVATNPADAYLFVDEMFALFFVSIPTGDRLVYFQQALLGGLTPTSWQFEWNNYISSNNNTAVKIALTSFFKAIVKSPEYQIY